MPLSIQDIVAVLRWPDVMLVRSCISANMHLINRITLYSDAPTQYLSFNQNRFWYSFGVMWPSNFGGSTHLWQTNCASYEQWTGSPVWGLLSHNVICSFLNVVCHSESPNSAMLSNHTPKITNRFWCCVKQMRQLWCRSVKKTKFWSKICMNVKVTMLGSL